MGPRKSTSHCDFQNAIISLELSGRNVNGQTTLHRLIKVVKQFLKGLALRGATGNGWNLRPETTFLRFVHYDFDFHGWNYNAKPRGFTYGLKARAIQVALPMARVKWNFECHLR